MKGEWGEKDTGGKFRYLRDDTLRVCHQKVRDADFDAIFTIDIPRDITVETRTMRRVFSHHQPRQKFYSVGVSR